MPENLYVLTRSASVARQLQRALPPGRRITRVACLAEIGRDVTEANVIIDPRALESCSTACLRVGHGAGVLRNISFLDLPARLRTVHHSRASVPPCVELGDHGATISPAPGKAPTNAAWRCRGRLFTVPPDEPRQGRFLDLARGHSHEAYREVDAAAELHLGVRHLSRLTSRWFGCSPKVILGLFRVESVACGLRLTVRGLKDLAKAHGYSSRQAMNRHFQSFTGVHPAAYRELQRRRDATKINPTMSDYGPSPDASDRGIYAAEGTLVVPRPIGVGRDSASTVAPIQAWRHHSTEPPSD